MNKLIIFADDNPDLLMAMCIVLERMNYDVIPAGNGLEVISLLEIITPDIIALDVDMPLLDGIETLKQIRQDANYARMPVLMLSDAVEEKTVDECRRLGCAGYLAKPVSLFEMLKVFDDCLYPGRGRKHLRSNLDIQATVSHDGASHKFYTKNLSESGVFVRTKEPLPVGSSVGVVLPLEGEDIQLEGHVVYTNTFDSKTVTFYPGMAIKFVNVSLRDSERLTSFVAGLIAQGLEDTGIFADDTLKERRDNT